MLQKHPHITKPTYAHPPTQGITGWNLKYENQEQIHLLVSNCRKIKNNL